MRAIILAAGMGSRLGVHTSDRPKGMVELFGKPLIAHQLNVLRKLGISDIVIARGYKAEMIEFKDVRYYTNRKFEETNMLSTLFCAEQELEGEILVLYSDILYEPRVIQKVMASSSSIGVVVDEDFHEYWQARVGDISKDSESLCIDNRGTIYNIGSPDPALDQMHARYVGMLSFSKEGTKALRKVYSEQCKLYLDSKKPWYNSPSLAKGYMTDMLQCLIDAGHEVHPIRIQRGWLEIDTVDDLALYQKWLNTGLLSRFINAESIESIP